MAETIVAGKGYLGGMSICINPGIGAKSLTYKENAHGTNRTVA